MVRLFMKQNFIFISLKFFNKYFIHIITFILIKNINLFSNSVKIQWLFSNSTTTAARGNSGDYPFTFTAFSSTNYVATAIPYGSGQPCTYENKTLSSIIIRWYNRNYSEKQTINGINAILVGF